jgi:hypothetical protein
MGLAGNLFDRMSTNVLKFYFDVDMIELFVKVRLTRQCLDGSIAFARNSDRFTEDRCRFLPRICDTFFGNPNDRKDP